MKRFVRFLSIFLILGLGIITVFSIKPKAYMHSDYKHIDDINYINVNHNFETVTTFTNQGNLSYFNIRFNDTSNIYGLPSTFETVSQVGSFNIYFNSNVSFVDFTLDYDDFVLTITNNGGFSYEYMPYKINIRIVGTVYHLNADFESGLFQELDIYSNNWSFDFKLYGDFSTGDFINVLSNYGVENQSTFKWFYYKDFDSALTDYGKGYTDGLSDGYEQGYNHGKDAGLKDGKEIGIEQGITIGKEIGFTDGYDKGINDATDHSFYGIIGQVFQGLGSFLSIQLLPNITFGAILSVPLVFGIISFIIGKRGGKDD